MSLIHLSREPFCAARTIQAGRMADHWRRPSGYPPRVELMPCNTGRDRT